MEGRHCFVAHRARESNRLTGGSSRANYCSRGSGDSVGRCTGPDHYIGAENRRTSNTVIRCLQAQGRFLLFSACIYLIFVSHRVRKHHLELNQPNQTRSCGQHLLCLLHSPSQSKSKTSPVNRPPHPNPLPVELSTLLLNRAL